MKKYNILCVVLVLTALSLTGCRSSKAPMESTTVPTTQATTAPTVMPTTEATVQPTEHTENATTSTEHTGETALPGDMNPDTTTATGEGQARSVPGKR